MTDTCAKHPAKKKAYLLIKNDRWRYSITILRCPLSIMQQIHNNCK